MRFRSGISVLFSKPACNINLSVLHGWFHIYNCSVRVHSNFHLFHPSVPRFSPVPSPCALIAFHVPCVPRFIHHLSVLKQQVWFGIIVLKIACNLIEKSCLWSGTFNHQFTVQILFHSQQHRLSLKFSSWNVLLGWTDHFWIEKIHVCALW